ncbi:hypothetical protein OAC30_00450 [Burkholderiaceae bacterium]|nr:hypothetical protein [Burkholderiaceae bacterium]
MSNMTLKKPAPVQATKAAAALAFAKPDIDKTTRLNANIKVELHTALKVRAATEGTTIGALIEEWITEWAGK